MKDEGGYVLVLSLVMLLVLVIISYAMSSLVASEIDFVSHSSRSTKTLYMAEAGIEYASALLTKSDKWEDGFLIDESKNLISNLSSNIDITSVEKSDHGASISVISTAEHSNGLTKTITVTYDKSNFVSDVYNYSLVANGDIDIKNKVTVEGINEDLDGDGVTEHYGDVYTTGTVDTQNKTEFINADYHDSTTMENPENIVPKIFDSVLNEVNDGTVDTGKIFYSMNDIYDSDGDEYVFADNIVYLDHSESFGNDEQIRGNGVLLINGDVEFKHGVDISTADGENLLIIVNGTITFKNSSQFNGMVYATEKVNIHAKVDVNGTVISDVIEEDVTLSVHSGGNEASTIFYDRSYLQIFDTLGLTLPTGGGSSNNFKLAEMISWKES